MEKRYCIFYIFNETNKLGFIGKNKIGRLPAYIHSPKDKVPIRVFSTYCETKNYLEDFIYLVKGKKKVGILNLNSPKNKKLVTFNRSKSEHYLKWFDKKALKARLNTKPKSKYVNATCIISDGTELIKDKVYRAISKKQFFIINDVKYLKSRFVNSC